MYFYGADPQPPSEQDDKQNALWIGDFIGKFISVDEEALTQRIRKFIRIRALVDTRESLKAGCMIDRDDGSQTWVSFKYEHIPEFCYHCDTIDHLEQACPNLEPSKMNQGKISWAMDLGCEPHQYSLPGRWQVRSGTDRRSRFPRTSATRYPKYAFRSQLRYEISYPS